MQMAKTRTLDAAVGKWPGILLALGVKEEFLQKKHGACPFCGGVDRYRFDNKDERGTFICSQCGAGDGMQFLIRLNNWTFAQAAKNVDSVIGNVTALPAQKQRTEAQKIAAIKKILSECRVVKNGDPVWLYLTRRTNIETIPTDIKYHPALYHSAGGEHPAMVSIVRGQNGCGVSLHRTYLTIDGRKAGAMPNKKFVEGMPLNGGSVRLSPIFEHIGIAEGIETALAAGVKHNIPTWAATNAVLLEQWLPPAGVERVTVFGDNDESFVGQSAAFNLAKKLTKLGVNVDVRIPEKTATDWAD